MQWPQDADGDVLRRMESKGFDFEKSCIIDFNVDFSAWPPPVPAIQLLEHQFPGKTKVYADDDNKGGYVQFKIHQQLSYDLVMQIQSSVSALMSPYGGLCESWGVIHG